METFGFDRALIAEFVGRKFKAPKGRRAHQWGVGSKACHAIGCNTTNTHCVAGMQCVAGMECVAGIYTTCYDLLLRRNLRREYVAVCCSSVLQCVAVCCSSVLQCVAVRCLVLQQCVAVYCSVFQCVAVCCSVMQCDAVCCSNMMQCVGHQQHA